MGNLKSSFGLFILVFSIYWITDFSVYWVNDNVEHFFVQDMKLVIKFIIITLVSIGIISIFNFESTRLRKKMQDILERTSGEALANTNKTLSYQSLPINTRLIKVTEIIEKEFNVDEIFIAIKSQTHLEIINQPKSAIFENNKISLKNNKDGLKNLIAKDFLNTQKEVAFQKLKNKKTNKQMFILNVPIISKHSKSRWGIITLLVPRKKENLEIILSQTIVIAENIALNLFLYEKSKQNNILDKKEMLKMDRDISAQKLKNSFSTIFIDVKDIENSFSKKEQKIKQIEYSLIAISRNLVKDIDILTLHFEDKLILILEETTNEAINMLINRLRDKIAELKKENFAVMEFVKISNENRIKFIKRLEKILIEGKKNS